MKRIALLAAAALAAGCVSSSTPPVYGDNVIVYATFQHFDYTGTFQNLTCSQAGVDYVVVAFSDGYSQTVSCTDAGIPFPGFAPGSYWVTVTGYRNGQAAALYYSGGVTFNKYAGTDAAVYADVQGIPGNLTLDPALFNGGVQYPTPACDGALVDHLSYQVRDGANIILAQGQVVCAAGFDPPIITFSGASAIDKDTLRIRMQALRTGAVVMDSCTMSFNHFGASDTALVDIVYPIPSPCL